MTQINSYLTFNGNCREAMTFYKECLGGELVLQPVGESPLSEKMPVKMKDCILHATLTRDKLVLMGSDMVPQTGLIKGNSVSLVLQCSTEEETREAYAMLSADGTSDHPLETTFWGALFGDLTDKYGHHWLINCERKDEGLKG